MTTATLRRLDRDDEAYDAAAAREAARCRTDQERAELAAYLYLLPELSLERIAAVFGVDVARARRLVERGSGTAPITAGDDCRGWALVAPQPGRTAAERAAAQGHGSLCRSCRNRLRAHQVVERRVAKAGSATLGVGVIAAVVRTIAGGSGALTSGGVPVAVLSGALAVTAGAGALVATLHHGPAGRGDAVVPVVRVTSPGAGDSGAVLRRRSSASAAVTRPRHQRGTASVPVAGTPTPGSSPSLPLPTSVPQLPGRDTSVPLVGDLPVPSVPVPSVPVPSVSPLTVPLPLPTISLSPPALLP